ncbi:hypothetical protein [Kitasatospora sp. NPDC050543]|uniref:hypothetical protein n=1 Tax=Kitasatospora sp. NPDC050543 TaxID=3364054 RepID=UPI0037903180
MSRRWFGGGVVLVAVLLCGVLWYVLREPALESGVDGRLQAALDGAVKGEAPVALAELTPFAWDRVQVFGEGDSDDEISDAVGDPVEWVPQATSYSLPSLWVFSKGGEAVRAVQLDVNVPVGWAGRAWTPAVKVSGGPHHNVLQLAE